MTKEEFANCERRDINKLSRLLIPNKFKKLGIGIAILSFAFMIVNKLSFDSETFRFFARHGLLLGFLLISISKEKIEDELVKNIRMQSYTFAFVFGVAYSILMPYLDYFVDTMRSSVEAVLKNSGDFSILWMLLAVQVFYFEYLKRLFK